MKTADDYIEVEPGKFVLRDRLPVPPDSSPVNSTGVAAVQQPRLLWAKDMKLEFMHTEPNVWGDFLWPSSIHLLSGEPGVGKTTLLYNLALKACCGESFLGIPFASALKCLYLDLETPYKLRARKLHIISEGKMPDHLGFIASANIEHDLGWLSDIVKEHGFNLIIVDTINEAFNTVNEDDNSEANRQMGLTRKLVDDTGASVLLVQHIGKGESTKGVFRARGASARPASADVVLNLEGSGDVIKLEMVKNRWIGGVSRLFIKKVGEDLFEPTEVSAEESMSAKTKAQDIILQALKRGPLTTAQIKLEAGDLSQATFERALSGLVQVGKIHKPQRGLYALTETSITSSPTLEGDVIDGMRESRWLS